MVSPSFIFECHIFSLLLGTLVFYWNMEEDSKSGYERCHEEEQVQMTLTVGSQHCWVSCHQQLPYWKRD